MSEQNIRIVQVRGVRIGEGRPKVCVPVTAAGEDALTHQLEVLGCVVCDLIEWRADCYGEAVLTASAQELSQIAGRIRDALGDKPLLFTFRTRSEGGCLPLDAEEYLALNRRAAGCGAFDLIDVEYFTAGEAGRAHIRKLQEAGCRVIASSHDFQRTPPLPEMVSRLRGMQEAGADITKLAVMPQEPSDVLRLIRASMLMKETYADRPCITMSMGAMGAVSRLCGSLSGSAVTFASGGFTSAPGQLPADRLTEILELLG